MAIKLSREQEERIWALLYRLQRKIFREQDEALFDPDVLEDQLRRWVTDEFMAGAPLPSLPEIISDGRSLAKIINDLPAKGYVVSGELKKRLEQSIGLLSVSRETIRYQPAIVKGSDFSPKDRVLVRVRQKATQFGFREPALEMALLFAESTPDQTFAKLGLRKIIVMHKPLVDYEGRAVGDDGQLMIQLFSNQRAVGLQLDRGDNNPYEATTGFLFLDRPAGLIENTLPAIAESADESGHTPREDERPIAPSCVS